MIMGTGLSPLQKSILDVLPEFREENGYIYEGMRVRTVLRAMKLENTAANNAAVSRSLLRLCQRDLVYGFRSFWQMGNHFQYCRAADEKSGFYETGYLKRHYGS